MCLRIVCWTAVLGPLLLFGSACSSRPKVESYTFSDQVSPNDYRPSEDRAALEALRKDIPPTVQAENDEKAFIEELLPADLSRSPEEARQKFNSTLQRKREKFNSAMSRERNAFQKLQQKEREDFGKETEKRRSEIKRKNLKKDRLKDAYDVIEQDRKDFNSQQRDASDKYYENYKAKQAEFSEQLKDLQSRFDLKFKDYREKKTELLKKPL